MSKYNFGVAIVAVLALLVSVFTPFVPTQPSSIGTSTTGEITYYPGSLDVTHDVVVGEELTVGTLNTSGSVTLGGSVTALTTSSASYALTAANVCDSSLVQFTPAGAITTVTLPATSTLFADCLTSNGQYHDVAYTSVATSTVLAAGTGGTLLYSSTTTVAAGKAATLRIIRDAATTYKAYLVNLPN